MSDINIKFVIVMASARLYAIDMVFIMPGHAGGSAGSFMLS